MKKIRDQIIGVLVYIMLISVLLLSVSKIFSFLGYDVDFLIDILTTILAVDGILFTIFVLIVHRVVIYKGIKKELDEE